MFQIRSFNSIQVGSNQMLLTEIKQKHNFYSHILRFGDSNKDLDRKFKIYYHLEPSTYLVTILKTLILDSQIQQSLLFLPARQPAHQDTCATCVKIPQYYSTKLSTTYTMYNAKRWCLLFHVTYIPKILKLFKGLHQVLNIVDRQ